MLTKKVIIIVESLIDIPTLVTVSALNMLWLPDVLPVDLSCDQLLLGDGNSGDDDDGQGDRVDGGIDGVYQSNGQEAGDGGDNTSVHFGGKKVGLNSNEIKFNFFPKFNCPIKCLLIVK